MNRGSSALAVGDSGLEGQEVGKVVVAQLQKKRFKPFFCLSQRSQNSLNLIIYQINTARLECLVELITSMIMFPLIDSTHQHVINFLHKVSYTINLFIFFFSKKFKHLSRIIHL